MKSKMQVISKLFLIFAVVMSVMAIGIAVYLKTISKPLTPYSTPTSTPTPTQSPEPVINDSDMKDWETYRNEEYGFEFKYPSNWQTTGDQPQSKRIVFMINHKNSKISSQINFNILNYSEYYSLHGYSQHKTPDENIEINGNKAEVYEYDNKYETTFINSGQYVFDYQELNQNNDKILKKDWMYFDDFNKILSTFKFTEKNESLTVRGRDIYYDNIKAGSIDGKTINIFLKNGTFSFEGELDKVNLFIPNEHVTQFSYNNLYVSGGLYRSNSSSPITITYKCDGPLVNAENVKYAYCETNGKDYLTQYEFSDFTSSGFGTGGGTSWQWYKLYIKKIDGVDFVFQGYIDDDWVNGPDLVANKSEEKYKELSTKEYLDKILADENTLEKIKEWDKFVEGL